MNQRDGYTMLKGLALRERKRVELLVRDLVRSDIDLHVLVERLERPVMYEDANGETAPDAEGRSDAARTIVTSFILLPEDAYDLFHRTCASPRYVLEPLTKRRVRLAAPIAVTTGHVAILASDEARFVAAKLAEGEKEQPRVWFVGSASAPPVSGPVTAAPATSEPATAALAAQPIKGPVRSADRKESWKGWHSDARLLGYLVLGLAETPSKKTPDGDLVHGARAACERAKLQGFQDQLVHGVRALVREPAKCDEEEIDPALLRVLAAANAERSRAARGRQGKVSLTDVAQDLSNAAAKAGRGDLAIKSLARLLRPHLSTSAE